MEQEHLKSVLESLLFVSNKPLAAKDFSKQLDVELPEVTTALASLVEERKSSGVVVLENNGEYQMATSSANSTQVKAFLNAELREKLTDATVEVLAIIAYRQPISKAEIEAIRGVNSQYSIRHLLMRGMIEKVPNPNDARGFLYQTTTEFLQHMGLTSVNDLPDFESLVSQIKLPEAPGISSAGTEAAGGSEPSDTNADSTAQSEVTKVTQAPTEATEPVESEHAEQILPADAFTESVATPESVPASEAVEEEPEVFEDDEDEFDDDEEDDDEA